jgi:hypothetical protein
LVRDTAERRHVRGDVVGGKADPLHDGVEVLPGERSPEGHGVTRVRMDDSGARRCVGDPGGAPIHQRELVPALDDEG